MWTGDDEMTVNGVGASAPRAQGGFGNGLFVAIYLVGVDGGTGDN